MAKSFIDVRQGLKYLVTVRIQKLGYLRTESVIDDRSGEMMPQEFLEEYGIERFEDEDEMKRVLCMELEGDPDRYTTMRSEDYRITAFIYD